MTSDIIQRQIARLLQEAEEAIARVDWEVVRQSAEALLVLDPDNTDGLALMAAAERGFRHFGTSSTFFTAISLRARGCSKN